MKNEEVVYKGVEGLHENVRARKSLRTRWVAQKAVGFSPQSTARWEKAVYVVLCHLKEKTATKLYSKREQRTDPTN